MFILSSNCSHIDRRCQCVFNILAVGGLRSSLGMFCLLWSSRQLTRWSACIAGQYWAYFNIQKPRCLSIAGSAERRTDRESNLQWRSGSRNNAGLNSSVNDFLPSQSLSIQSEKSVHIQSGSKEKHSALTIGKETVDRSLASFETMFVRFRQAGHSRELRSISNQWSHRLETRLDRFLTNSSLHRRSSHHQRYAHAVIWHGLHARSDPFRTQALRTAASGHKFN